MPKTSLCTANINLAGDLRATVRKGEFNPITWPEVEVLRWLHGDTSVWDVKVIDSDNRAMKDEFERLTLKYGSEVTKMLFPGARPAMLMEAPKEIPRVRAQNSKSQPAAPKPDPLEGVET